MGTRATKMCRNLRPQKWRRLKVVFESYETFNLCIRQRFISIDRRVCYLRTVQAWRCTERSLHNLLKKLLFLQWKQRSIAFANKTFVWFSAYSFYSTPTPTPFNIPEHFKSYKIELETTNFVKMQITRHIAAASANKMQVVVPSRKQTATLF